MTDNGSIFVTGVSKKFGDFWALRNINCKIAFRKITGFVGPNGAGKTTLFHVITGDLRPDAGKVSYNGMDITAKPPWMIARMGIGKLFQDVRIFPNLTVLENVLVALLKPEDESPIKALNMLRMKKILKDKIDEASHWVEFVGLEEFRNVRAEDLSFGQQKLLSFARLMAGGFKILLLDEPTAGVHPRMIKEIEDLLHKMVEEKGITVAVIEHNMSVILNIAEIVYFMNEGRIEWVDVPENLLRNKEVKETYMGF